MQTSRSKSTSNLEYDVIHNPNQVVVYRKILLRKLGKPLFKVFKNKIARVTENTIITEKGKGHQEKPYFSKTKIYVS